MTLPTQRGPTGARPWTSLALAAGTLVVCAAVSAWIAQPGDRPAGACRCTSEDELRRELTELRSGLEQLRFAVQLSAETGPQLIHPGPSAPGASTAAATVERRAVPPPSAGSSDRRYIRFDVPASQVTVHQAPTGELVVQNIEPSLTGSNLEITAHTADGAADTILITVPAPAR